MTVKMIGASADVCFFCSVTTTKYRSGVLVHLSHASLDADSNAVPVPRASFLHQWSRRRM